MTSRHLSHFLVLLHLLVSGALLLPAGAKAEARRIPLGPTPLVDTSYRPFHLTQVGDLFFFTGYDPLYGDELWVSDGTTSGTRRLTDLCPGACSRYTGNLQGAGGRVFFTASEFEANSLYVLEGEELSLIARFPGFIASSAAVGGSYFLQVEQPVGGETNILRSKGRPGDLEVFDRTCIQADGNCTFTRLETLGGYLFYIKHGIFQRVDPESGVASHLAELDYGRLIGAAGGGRFLFRGCRPGLCPIWSSDGTREGTSPLLGDNPLGYGQSYARWNGATYWVTGQGQLVGSDGSVAGTFVVAGVSAEKIIGATPRSLFYIRHGNSSRDIRLRAYSPGGSDVELLAFDYFDPELVGTAGNSIFVTNGATMHVSDGTLAGTRLLERVVSTVAVPGVTLGDRLYAPAYSRTELYHVSVLQAFDEQGNYQDLLPPRQLRLGDDARPVANSSLFAWTPDDPAGFWRVDPQTFAATPAGAPDLIPLAAAGDRLVARAPSGRLFGVTPQGVERLPSRSFSAAASPDGHFYWGEAFPGQVLWESDGTAASTRAVADFRPGWVQGPCTTHCSPSFPASLRVDGDLVYLVASAAPDTGDVGVWVYRRSSGERILLKTFRYSQSAPVEFLPVAGKMAFVANGLEGEHGLWITDGTPAGTYLLQPTTSEFGISECLGAVGQRIFFTNYKRDRLWASDLAPGHSHLLLERSDLTLVDGAVAAGDRLFFNADTHDLGSELWSSDGTPAGTRALDLRPGVFGSWPDSLLAVGSRVIFAADTGGLGRELYQSDGTRDGTTLLADLAPGPLPSSPANLVALGERLFFTADDGTSGRVLWSFDLPEPRPGCPADRLCLQGGRFEVSVDAGATSLAGRRVLTSAESGVFSFFTPNNWELLVKVLDGCELNDHFWVYSAAATDVPYTLTIDDRATGERKTYEHAGGDAATPDLDPAAFATCGAAPPATAYAAVLPLAPAAPRCPDDFEAFCFGPGGRFRAKAAWQTPSAGGTAHPEPYGSPDSGIFSFFSPVNWELMVKVLDGCALNGRRWVYVAGTTDVGWQLTVEDRETGAIRHYRNENGEARSAITDAQAFACP